MKKVKYNKKYDFFLKKYGLENIDTSKITINKYKKNEYVFYENEKIESMYILVQGKIKTFSISESGKNLVYGIQKQPYLFGEIEFITNKKYTTLNFLVSTKTAECIEIPMIYFRDWLLNEPVFLNKLSLALAKKLRIRDIISKITILYSLKERLCAYIIYYSKNKIFKTNLTELAEIMGVSYRHLLRGLSELVNEKIIEKKENYYLIIDRERLRKSCENLIDYYCDFCYYISD